MSAVNRKPALERTHPADRIPDRPSTDPNSGPAAPPPAAPAPTRTAAASGPTDDERLNEQHNVRIRASTKQRLGRAVDKLRYETGDRSISIASITDLALREYMDRNDC